MRYFSVADIANITKGKLIGTGEDSVGEIIIDSRLVKKGDLFVAFKGDKVDGHAYVGTAFENGASCCLVQHPVENVCGSMIVVDNVQAAIEKIALACREKLNIPVVGITGSVGKTTAKEMIFAVLSQRWNTLKTNGNHNNQIGVPMTLSRIEREHQAAVVEMGISGFGEMDLLSSMAKPTMGVFTYIGHAHLEFLHDLDGVFRAKTEMLAHMVEDAPLIINGDDEKLRQLRTRKNVISFGLGEDCDVRASDVGIMPDGSTECTLNYKDERIHILIPAYGQHMVYAAAEGAAVGFALGLGCDEIKNGIAAYHTVGRRGAVSDTGFITIVDDCYNSNPDSLACAIDSLAKMQGRKVCVLSDMRELGNDSPEMHSSMGRYARKSGVELLLACGPLSKYMCDAFGKSAIYFESKAELIEALPEYILRGDCVLVKASLGMHLEDAAETLKKLRG